MLNRDRIFAAVREQIAACADTADRFGVLVMHVAGLREIALRFGWAPGEQAQEDARQLIEQSLRPIDRAFRSGDENFTVVLPNLPSQNHVLLAAMRLLKAFERPMNTATSPWLARVTIGMAFFPEHGADADLLCRRAQAAVDEALRRGEQWAFYSFAIARMEIFHEELRVAIEANELLAYFQPVWDLRDGRMSGVESLARRNSARHGEVHPADFVPFAEQSDLIWALTRWSINATLRSAALLGQRPGFSFAVNLSPRVFTRPGLVEQFLDALSIWGLAASAMVVEVTETSLVRDLDATVQVLRRLRDQGMRVAIDDFGTGYSSIAYLSRFPATELKIDKSLVGLMKDDARSEKLVGAVIELAHRMDMATVAEGIEDQATQHSLVGMGCDFGQGYYLGHPEPAGDFVRRFAPPAPSA
jgi:diguanylate cyclase (GGDEF)-like protein